MRTLILLAAIAPLVLAVGTAPSVAETTVVKKKVVRHGHMGGVHKKVVIKKRHPMGGGTTVKTVVKHHD